MRIGHMFLVKLHVHAIHCISDGPVAASGLAPVAAAASKLESEANNHASCPRATLILLKRAEKTTLLTVIKEKLMVDMSFPLA